MDNRRMTLAAGIAAAMMAPPANAEGADGVWNLTVEVVAPRADAVVRDADGLPLWDLSTVLGEAKDGVAYRVYGDSLVSEELGGVRCWYAASADSCGLRRMEGLLWRLDPLTPAPAGRWAATALPAQEAFSAAIARESLANDTLACRLERDADIAGCLVLPGADTLRAVMRRECIGVTDVGGEYVRESRRWFAASGQQLLPLAAAVATSYAGRALDDVAYVPSPVVLAEMDVEDEPTVEQALEAVDLRLDGRRLNVTVRQGALAGSVRIDVTDTAGRSYAGATIDGAAGGTVQIDLSGLPSGVYLAVLSSGGAIRKEPLRL